MGDLRSAYDETVGTNGLVEEVDGALVAAGRAIADEIDHAVENLSGQERTKALYLMPHLMNILREMYATPKSRKEADLGQEVARGKLAEIRELRKRPAPSKKRTG